MSHRLRPTVCRRVRAWADAEHCAVTHTAPPSWTASPLTACGLPTAVLARAITGVRFGRFCVVAQLAQLATLGRVVVGPRCSLMA